MKIIFTSITIVLLLSISLNIPLITSAEEEKGMEPKAAESGMILITESDITWGDVPPALPTGAKIAVLEGDPFKPEPYSLRLMMPANYEIPAHWHTMIERVTVLSGTLNVGMGDKLDKTQGKAFTAGGFVFFPAKMNHYAWAGEDTIIQINGDGPWDINYINPADDPRNKNKN